ncbi:MAG: lipopolysaccharide biosynthesis protein [Pseudomonadales bacterium]|nr:lipopolysaccharide biosynthesis protein [Pseudomonadales bacterium]
MTQSSLKNVMQNAATLFAGNTGASIFGLISMAIFTHTMGPTIFGYYILFLTFIEIVDRVFNFQTWQAFIKYATEFKIKGEDRKILMLLKYSVLIDSLTLSVAFSIALISAGYVTSFFNIPAEYSSFLSVLAFSIALNIFNISTGVFRLFDEYKIQAKITVYTASTKTVLFGGTALYAPTFENFIYATILSKSIGTLLIFLYTKKILLKNDIKFAEIVKERIDRKLLNELGILSFIIYNNFDVAVRMISRQLDIIILGKLYSAEIVGLYRTAKEISNFIAKLGDPIYQAIYPELAALLASGNKLEAKKIAKQISLYACGVGFVFYLSFLVLGEFAIVLVFGQEFLSAYGIILIYFFANFVAVVTLPLYPMQHAFGFAREAFYNQLYTTLVYIPILIFLTIELKMIGAAISYVAYYLLLTKLTLKSVKKGFSSG